MPRGKSINLFLMDGDASGRIKCTLANWTGVAYKIPRTELDKCREREDLKQSGVYFLFGNSDKDGTPVVYIGQAGARKNGEGILNRLQEHKRNPEKDYWSEAVVFTTSNNSFGPTEISYLENRFCNLAVGANRYEVKNGNDPTPGNITEEKESELEEFIDFAKIIMGTLGHKVFIPLTQQSIVKDAFNTNISDDETELFLSQKIKKYNFQVEASAKQTSEGFVVLKGSLIGPGDSEHISVGNRKKREECSIDNNRVLQEDVLFSSPTSAAQFVTGQSLNGWIVWKTRDGKTLHDIENGE